MTKNIIITGIVALVVSLVVGGFMSAPTDQNIDSFGGLSERDIKAVSVSVGQTGSASGSKLTFVKSGTCSLVSNSSIAATSTGTGTCAVTGSRTGDLALVSLATSTTKMSAQWAIVGTLPTTDSITVRLLNLTGTGAVPAATNGLGSSTQYYLFRATN